MKTKEEIILIEENVCKIKDGDCCANVKLGSYNLYDFEGFMKTLKKEYKIKNEVKKLAQT